MNTRAGCWRDLTRYWIETADGRRFGVTAAGLDDALDLLLEFGWGVNLSDPGTLILENVDVSELDPADILPIIGPTIFRGVWYPALNLTHSGVRRGQ